MESIKTFPIQLTESFHERLRDQAIKNKMALKKYVLLALQEKLEKEEA